MSLWEFGICDSTWNSEDVGLWPEESFYHRQQLFVVELEVLLQGRHVLKSIFFLIFLRFGVFYRILFLKHTEEMYIRKHGIVQ